MGVLSLFGRGAAAGTPDMHERLVQSRAGLYRLALMWSQDPSLADDLTQDALAKALQRCAQLRDAAKLRPWLCGILLNCWRDHLRARRPTEDIDEIDEHWLAAGDGTEQGAARLQLAARVRAAIARLPLGQREVLALVDLEECTYAEVAQMLALPIGTVMSRLCRARAALRTLLADVQSHEAGGVTPGRLPLRSVK
jgi:RNA polymerase sigma-70 factor (ECF subfamily)